MVGMVFPIAAHGGQLPVALQDVRTAGGGIRARGRKNVRLLAAVTCAYAGYSRVFPGAFLTRQFALLVNGTGFLATAWTAG